MLKKKSLFYSVSIGELISNSHNQWGKSLNQIPIYIKMYLVHLYYTHPLCSRCVSVQIREVSFTCPILYAEISIFLTSFTLIALFSTQLFGFLNFFFYAQSFKELLLRCIMGLAVNSAS